MLNEQLLSWLVGAIGISGFFLAGRKVWWSWYVNIACQLFWVLYAIASSTPAFLVTAAFYTAVFSINAWKWTRDRHKVSPDAEDSNTVQHARAELKLLGEEPETIEYYVGVIKEYAKFGHSGGSHAAVLPVLIALLDLKPLTALSNDPTEWYYHGEEVWGDNGGIWQNRRNGRAFSKDGGKTYYLVDDPTEEGVPRTIYKSRGHEIVREVH